MRIIFKIQNGTGKNGKCFNFGWIVLLLLSSFFNNFFSFLGKSHSTLGMILRRSLLNSKIGIGKESNLFIGNTSKT